MARMHTWIGLAALSFALTGCVSQQKYDAVKLENDQLQAITELRQSFLEKIGGPNADPNSPAYRDCWQKAQPEIDEALAGAIGRKAFLEYESLAVTANQSP